MDFIVISGILILIGLAVAILVFLKFAEKLQAVGIGIDERFGTKGAGCVLPIIAFFFVPSFLMIVFLLNSGMFGGSDVDWTVQRRRSGKS